MKSTSTLASILKVSLASATLLASAALSQAATDRTLILLQENTGNTGLNDYIDGPLEDAVVDFIDNLAEGFETSQFQSLVAGKYQRFVNLSDTRCTRNNLLNELIRQTRDGYDIDLVILGHGTREKLILHEPPSLQINSRFSSRFTFPSIRRLPFVADSGELTGGTRGNIRSLRRDASTLTNGEITAFNLRLVYMCNCWGSTLNDDWIAAGAKVSVGSRFNNFMPEPMINLFFNGFIHGDKRVSEAAHDSFTYSRALWTPIYGDSLADEAHCLGDPTCEAMTMIEQSRPVVLGQRHLIFDDEKQLDVGESKVIRVYANQANKLGHVHLVAGQRYRFQATGNWRKAPWASYVSANGTLPTFWEKNRHAAYNTMALVGEYFNKNNILTYSGRAFRIGTSRTITASRHGFLNLLANENFFAYGDNAGSVRVTITRTQ